MLGVTNMRYFDAKKIVVEHEVDERPSTLFFMIILGCMAKQGTTRLEICRKLGLKTMPTMALPIG
jgi:hypothetical protein